jgi:hypothetical protein
MRFASICAMKDRGDYNTPHRQDNMSVILGSTNNLSGVLGEDRTNLRGKEINTCQLPFFCLYCAR